LPPDFIAKTLANGGSDVLERLGAISALAGIRQGGGHHRSRERVPSLRNLHRKGPRCKRIDLRGTARTWANPARKPTVLNLEQTSFGHPVQVKGGEPWFDPRIPRGLFAPDRLLALAQIQVKLLASRLSQQRNRR